MNVVIQGTKQFNEYQIFLRAMGVALSNMPDDDLEFNIYSLGPSNINSMASEFFNLSERGMKGRGKKLKYYKVPVDWVEENIEYMNYFVYLSKPKEHLSKLISTAQLLGKEVGVFKF